MLVLIRSLTEPKLTDLSGRGFFQGCTEMVFLSVLHAFLSVFTVYMNPVFKAI